MGRYVARRLLQAIPMLFLLSIALFVLVNVAPGGIARVVEFGSELVTVVPGIRLSDQSGDDQARVATPGQAAKDGASFLVIGRSVTRSDDPVATLKRIEEEIRNA